MPYMDGFKLLELVHLEMDLPVIMLSANDDHELVIKGINLGACHYLVKPVRLQEMRNIWQHVVRKKNVPKNLKKSNDPLIQTKGSRLTWSNTELYNKIITAVDQIGLHNATPDRILGVLNIEGLTKQNVASRLKRYMSYLKRQSQASLSSYASGGMLGRLNSPADVSLCNPASSPILQPNHDQNLSINALKLNPSVLPASQNTNLFQGIHVPLELDHLQQSKYATHMGELNHLDESELLTTTSTLMNSWLFGSSNFSMPNVAFNTDVSSSNFLDHDRYNDNWQNSIQPVQFQPFQPSSSLLTEPFSSPLPQVSSYGGMASLTNDMLFPTKPQVGLLPQGDCSLDDLMSAMKQLPDYHEVENPMDFATVRNKLGSGSSYATLSHFEEQDATMFDGFDASLGSGFWSFYN